MNEGQKLLGICVGMQLLGTIGFEGASSENCPAQGLNLISGEVVRLDNFGCKNRLPHVGWNSVEINKPGEQIFSEIPNSTDFYFVHSYALRVSNPADEVATVTYGVQVPVVVRKGNVWGAQFHPEKSSKAGAKFLKNFLGLN